MSAAAVSESMTIPAVPEQVGAARAFVAGVPGGTATVSVAAEDRLVRVEVTDRCGDGGRHSATETFPSTGASTCNEHERLYPGVKQGQYALGA